MFVDYRYDETQHWGETEIKQSFRHLDASEQREGRWIATYAMQVQIFDDPKIAKIDPNTYDAYVGRYALSSTVIDTVGRNGDKLFIQGQDEQTPTEISPESADTFFIPGDPTRLRFVRDANGKVIALSFDLVDWFYMTGANNPASTDILLQRSELRAILKLSILSFLFADHPEPFLGFFTVLVNSNSTSKVTPTLLHLTSIPLQPLLIDKHKTGCYQFVPNVWRSASRIGSSLHLLNCVCPDNPGCH